MVWARTWYDSNGLSRETIHYDIAAGLDQVFGRRGNLVCVGEEHWRYDAKGANVRVSIKNRGNVTSAIDVESDTWKEAVKLLYVIEDRLRGFTPLYWRNMNSYGTYDDLGPEAVCDVLRMSEEEFAEFWKEVEVLL